MDMLHTIRRTLVSWCARAATPARAPSRARALVLSGAGRAFCAGGDIRSVALQTMSRDNSADTTTTTNSKWEHASQFFTLEDELDWWLSTLHIPVVSLLHGPSMGGGLGLCVHSSHPVVCTDVRFAMPETAIGLIPDVGGCFFLARLAGALGTYLALTGVSISAADVLYAGISRFAIDASQRATVLSRLVRLPFSADPTEAREQVDSILREFHQPQDLASCDLNRHRAWIDAYFADASHASVASILTHLEAGSRNSSLEQDERTWCSETRSLLRTRSPLSLILTLECLRRSRRVETLAQGLCLEHRLVQRLLRGDGDFHEGVRALLIDKDKKPRWKSADLAQSGLDLDPWFAPLCVEADGVTDLVLTVSPVG